MKNKHSIMLIEEFVHNQPQYKNYAINYVSNGVSTEVYKLSSKDEILYLRIVCDDENISTEVLAHNLLKDKGVLCSKVIQYEDYNNILDASYMITSEIPGSALSENLPSINEIVKVAGKQLAVINSIKIDGFGWIDRKKPNLKYLKGVYPTFSKFAFNDNKIKSMLDDLVNATIITNNLKMKYLKYYSKLKETYICNQAVLAHGDFCIDHIFQNNGKYSGIIDFGDIRAMSIYHDLGHFYTYSPNLFPYLLSGYLEVNKLEKDFMKNIEFDAMLFGLRKLCWKLDENQNKLIKKKHPVVSLFEKVLG